MNDYQRYAYEHPMTRATGALTHHHFKNFASVKYRHMFSVALSLNK